MGLPWWASIFSLFLRPLAFLPQPQRLWTRIFWVSLWECSWHYLDACSAEGTATVFSSCQHLNSWGCWQSLGFLKTWRAPATLGSPHQAQWCFSHTCFTQGTIFFLSLSWRHWTSVSLRHFPICLSENPICLALFSVSSGMVLLGLNKKNTSAWGFTGLTRRYVCAFASTLHRLAIGSGTWRQEKEKDSNIKHLFYS